MSTMTSRTALTRAVLAVPALSRVSQLEHAAYREGLTLPVEACRHGRAGCTECVADAVRRLAALIDA